MSEHTRRSRAVEDYLKAIYKLQQEHGQVPTTLLAAELSRSPASVTNMVKGLAAQDLVVTLEARWLATRTHRELVRT